MKDSLKKLDTTLKTDTIITLALSIIIGVFVIINAVDVIMCLSKDQSAFQIKLTDTGVNHSQEYCLYIDGKKSDSIDYNDYALYTFDGETNYKAATIINKIQNICNLIIVDIILILLFRLFTVVKNGKTPFVKTSVTFLRAIACFCIALAVLSPIIGFCARFITFGYAVGSLETINFYIIITGCVFLMIAEIFNYGIILQEDSDSIA